MSVKAGYYNEKRNASGKIIFFEDYLQKYKNTPVIAYVRISSKYAKHTRKKFYLQQITELRQSNLKIHKTVYAIEKRWEFKNRKGLKKAISLSQKTKYPILVMDITRLIGYKNKHKIPYQKRIQKFLKYFSDVLFIIKNTNEEIKSKRTKRGQIQNKGGGDKNPGYKKRRKERLQKHVQELRTIGKSYRQISQELNIPKITVWRWCQI